MNTATLKPIAIGSALAIGLVGTGLWIGSVFATPTASPVAAVSTPQGESDHAMEGDEQMGHDDAIVVPDAVEVTTAEEELLLFLIEEEKLAHDVYVTLGDIWGSQVFDNITRSEVTHQDRVAELVAAAGLTDPRSTEIGVFQNDELQALYDSLIAQGSVSETAAFEVGVAIEELDIADITRMLPTVNDPTITAVLESLRSASEKHLAAFTRQLG